MAKGAKGTTKVTAKTTGWERVVTAITGLDGSKVRVGLLAGNPGESGQSGSSPIKNDDGETGEFNLATLGAVHEFGTADERIPARPWLRETFRARQSELIKHTALVTRAVIRKGMPFKQAYELLGLWGAAAVKTYVKGNNIKPGTSQATIDAKSKDGKIKSTTLIDTGIMVNSVTYDVDMRGAKKGADK